MVLDPGQRRRRSNGSASDAGAGEAGAGETVQGVQEERSMKSSTKDAKRLAETVMRAAGDQGYVAMVFCDSRFKRVLENWLLFAESCGEKFPILICALDEALANEMTDRGYPTYHVPWAGQLPDLWRIRVRVIEQVLSLGIDVVHSDADAVWRSSPMPFLREHASSDVVISQGTGFPVTALKSWGYVLCCGFVYFKSTKPTLWLLGYLSTAAQKARGFSDQQVLNKLLIERELAWELPDAVSYTHLTLPTILLV